MARTQRRYGWVSRDDQRAYQRRWKRDRARRLRREAVKRAGGKCVGCGEDQYVLLEFHHKDRSQKRYYIGQIWTLRRELREAELVKCELRCNECHIVETVNDRIRERIKESEVPF